MSLSLEQVQEFALYLQTAWEAGAAHALAGHPREGNPFIGSDDDLALAWDCGYDSQEGTTT